MRRTFRSLVLFTTVVSLALLVACGGPTGSPDASKPSVRFSISTGATINSSEPIRVTATDNDRGVKSVKVVISDLGGSEIGTLANVTFEDLDSNVTVDATLDSDVAAKLELGESYRLHATATNGANRVGTVQIGVKFGDSAPGGGTDGPGEGPNGPSVPGDPADPDSGLPPLTVFWELPHMGSTLAGIVPLQAALLGDETVTSVRFELLSDDDRTLIAGLVDEGDGRYSGSLDTTLYPGGPYVLQATFTSSTGAVAVAARSISISDQLPKVKFLAPSPTPNQRLAGMVRYQLAIEAPRGFQSLVVDLVQEESATEMGRYEGLSDGDTVADAFVTLEIEPGAYELTATITDVRNNELSYAIPIELLPVFTMTTPENGDRVGNPNVNRLVAVTVGITGAVRSDLEITSADFYVNGISHADGLLVDESADNFLVLYMWDTNVDGPGHDSTVNGDRHLTFLVHYQYEDSEGATQTGAVFAPPIVVTYEP